tara:strand:+ start:3132 stop:4211 length:1080 start_codon:yes stop_codon:yes gene_type:complete
VKIHEKFMSECIRLANKGRGKTKTNPLVGCVVVHNRKIISSGYHEKYGGNHAEVNAINFVKNKEILNKCTLYVNLEPCSHYGKTPPCTKLIQKYNFKNIVIGTIDPFNKVNGRGIELLKEKSNVIVGVLTRECIKLNISYFINNLYKRPFVILKWAETNDGFINNNNSGILEISSDEMKSKNHKWRSKIDSIMVGTNTVLNDNPLLTTRHIVGKNPIRISFDYQDRFKKNLNILNKDAETIIFNKKDSRKVDNVEYIKISKDLEKLDNKTVIIKILNILYRKDIKSLIVEGGSKLLQSYIDSNNWDEIRIIKNKELNINSGIKAPKLSVKLENKIEKDLTVIANNQVINKIEQMFLNRS